MLSFDSKNLTTKEQYKLLIGSILPRPIALVSSQSQSGVINIAPFSFFNIVAYQPGIVSISIQRKNGEMKDTARNILERKEAVVHIVDAENVKLANETAAPLPEEISELSVADFEVVPSEKIETPGLQPANVRYETLLYQHIPITNDEGMIVSDLFLLRVVHNWISEKAFQNGYVLEEELKPVSRLAGNKYAMIGEVFSITRPE